MVPYTVNKVIFAIWKFSLFSQIEKNSQKLPLMKILTKRPCYPYSSHKRSELARSRKLPPCEMSSI